MESQGGPNQMRTQGLREDAPGAEDAARKVTEDGYLIVRDAIEPELIVELRSRLDELLDELAIPFGPNVFLGEHTRRLFNLLARDARFGQVPLHQAVLPVVERVLDRECLLSSLTGVDVGPGETEQPFHADDGSIGLPKPHLAITCTAIWALTDFRADNGGTRVVPGSHRLADRPRKGAAPEFVHVEMPAGSVLIYHGSLWHAGGTNRTSERRAFIVSNYCAGFLRQEENQLLAVPRELVRGFPPRLQQLIGYGTYKGLMGHVDQQSPAALLDAQYETDMVWRRMR